MYQLTENFGGTIGNLKMKLFLYVKCVHNIFDCCRVAHVNRIFSKSTIPYIQIITANDVPKMENNKLNLLVWKLGLLLLVSSFLLKITKNIKM